MSSGFRQGARVAVDVGSVRVGVAGCDPEGTLVFPLAVLARDRRVETDLTEIQSIAADRGAIEIVVGWPRTLAGKEGHAAREAGDYARRLAARSLTDVRLVDERLSTVEAGRRLQAAGRDSRGARPVIDAAAAVVILESALDIERRTGQPPGQLIRATGVGGS